jgi:ribosomal protein S18 acetylase RimI-like enzyme
MTLIRPATLTDAQDIARIHADSWRSAYRGLLPQHYLDAMSPFTLRVRWERRLRWNDSRPAERDADAWVIEREQRVLGFFVLEPVMDDEELAGFAGEVSMLYVDPEHTRQGLGRALLDRAQHLLADREYYWLIIWVLDKNQPARAFYEHAGLRLDGAQRQDRFVNQRVEVVRYAKPLNPAIDFTALARGSLVR